MKRLATILLTLAALAGAPEFVPTLSANASGDGSYSFKPQGSLILTVRNEDDATIYMKATLGKVDLVPVGTIGAAYTSFTTDFTDIYVTEAGEALGPAALNAVVNSGTTTLDLEFSLPGGNGTDYFSPAQMLTDGYVCGNSFSGALTALSQRLSLC